MVPIIQAFEENGDKYNMINSAVIEMFEFIRVVSLIFLHAMKLIFIGFLWFGFYFETSELPVAQRSQKLACYLTF